MKKRIIIAVIVILVGIAAVAAYAYFASFHKVTVSFSPDVTSATLYKEDGKEIEKVSTAKEVLLQNGTYYAVPEGQKVSDKEITFTVKDSGLELALDPDYSTDFLQQTLVKEQSAITTAATTSLPLIAQSYSIEEGTLYRHGEWFGALLIQKTADIRDERDFYRIILHKESDTWKVVGKPELVMTKVEFKNVPASVLKSVNQLTQ
jgi:flagellar basal body-associated protein FliL